MRQSGARITPFDDGRNGLLIPAGDVGALHIALNRARTAPDLRERLGAEGRRMVHSRFTWTEAARLTTAVLDTAIERRAATCPGQIGHETTEVVATGFHGNKLPVYSS